MRVVFRFLLGLALVIVVAWLGLWWYAEGRMQSGVAAWADRIAAQGGEVSYGSLKRGLSPVTAAITLADVRISRPAAAAQAAVLTLPSLGFRINLFNPLLLHIDLPQRVDVGLAGVDTVVSFGGVSETEQLDPHVLTSHQDNPFRGGDFSATDVDVLASGGSLLVLHIDAISGHATIDLAAGPGATAFGGRLGVTGLALSPLLTHLLSIPFDGRLARLTYQMQLSGPVPPGLAPVLRQLDTLPPTDMPDRQKLVAPLLQRWAAAGGHGGFGLTISIGQTSANADANLSFDANVQPGGTANLTASHLDALTAELTKAYPQLQGAVTEAEAELSPYLSSSPQNGQSLAVHLVFGDGKATINGQPAAPLPPVNWNALENPAPAQ